MVYQIRFTERADKSIDSCLDYLLYQVESTGNPQAAKNFMKDFEQTLNILKVSANSFPFYEDERLRKKGFYKIHFLHHNYKIFYRIDEDMVIIEIIMHDLQDYQNILQEDFS